MIVTLRPMQSVVSLAILTSQSIIAPDGVFRRRSSDKIKDDSPISRETQLLESRTGD